MKKFIAWLKQFFGGKKAIPTPQPVPVPQPVPIKPTPVDAPVLGRKIDCPEWARGGECPVPGGLDIRFDVACDGDYCFAGDFLAPYTQIKRNATGSYWLSLPDVTSRGVLFHCESYNFPSSASQKVSGNTCNAYDKSGTFRFWVQCYEVEGNNKPTGQLDPLPKPVTSNVPAWTCLKDIPTYNDTSRPAELRLAKQGEFHGSFRVANADEATSARYMVINWFWRNGISTGYSTPTSPKSGSVDTKWDTTLPLDASRDLTWGVNP
jgi:hypothetical protein